MSFTVLYGPFDAILPAAWGYMPGRLEYSPYKKYDGTKVRMGIRFDIEYMANSEIYLTTNAEFRSIFPPVGS